MLFRVTPVALGRFQHRARIAGKLPLRGVSPRFLNMPIVLDMGLGLGVTEICARVYACAERCLTVVRAGGKVPRLKSGPRTQSRCPAPWGT